MKQQPAKPSKPKPTSQKRKKTVVKKEKVPQAPSKRGTKRQLPTKAEKKKKTVKAVKKEKGEKRYKNDR